MIFSIILFCLLVCSGVLWIADAAVFRKRRAPGTADPWWVEYGGGFFPVILIVFSLRSFVIEPFRIPSGSMNPTLLSGDFILVNKFEYGIRLPIVNRKIVSLNSPQRGDVMVFRYPEDPSTDFIKRVIGLPGDKVAYQNKRLFINGQAVETRPMEDYLHLEQEERQERGKRGRSFYSRQFAEKLGAADHRTLNDDDVPAFILNASDFAFRENCLYNREGVICTVPANHYFMMGDNRDNSRDSRFWGFVPEENIVGKAFFIWLNFGNLKRVGTFQ